ncbi:MAG: RNA polymerase-binding protein DksA [Campylobacterota bacterium]|nr:RNA polymerase-binding protein DksA [Campylobacterota bacterium]
MQQSELNYFKDLLEERKLQIVKNISGVNEELIQLGKEELNDDCDYATNNNYSSVESAIISQQQAELKEIDISLVKIASSEFGVCEMCEDLIGFQRLKVKPHATYCFDCREIAEKSK